LAVSNRFLRNSCKRLEQDSKTRRDWGGASEDNLLSSIIRFCVRRNCHKENETVQFLLDMFDFVPEDFD
jgi:hypothetical protein